MTEAGGGFGGEPGLEEVERVAGLARLELDPEEAKRLATEMASVLRHFRAIRRYEEEAPAGDAGDPSGEGPGGAGSEPGGLRPDEVDPEPLRRPISELAPAWRDGLFVVPRLPQLGGTGAQREEGEAGEPRP